MGIYEFALVFSLVVVLYNYQQIKIILKDKGYPVEMLTGWLRDLRHFKEMLRKEKDQKKQAKYLKIINALYFALAGSGLFAILVLNQRL